MIQPGDTYTLPLPLPAPVQPEGAANVDPVPAWRRALDAAIATDPRGKAGVAERMGGACTRAYVSRVANGDLTARPPAKFIQRVELYLMRVECPYLGASITPTECATYAARSYAQVSHFEVAHWRACRNCPMKGEERATALAADHDRSTALAQRKLDAKRAARGAAQLVARDQRAAARRARWSAGAADLAKLADRGPAALAIPSSPATPEIPGAPA
ncbi:hypothetical protein LNV08_11835 [Paucibacter sp. TC2R-5]|uniref:hypothetical protein n=1 Tax=Paucibacter sp. TC2R-5 TaxID=2893555 RepID=UPI0021E4450B|nr:hypothetical protein [Paucibacter sp. TC2R-5]MCV2359660.1 hypothetical protein [Paucibacter sp. TC2R-5]